MTLHSAADILSKTEFNNHEDWQTYPTSDYCCQKCKQVVSIDLKSLTKHQLSDFSNFNETDKKAFELFNSKINPKTNSFIDFYCPTCKRPVRIYYDSWAGGRHGEAGHTIKFVID